MEHRVKHVSVRAYNKADWSPADHYPSHAWNERDTRLLPALVLPPTTPAVLWSPVSKESSNEGTRRRLTL